LALLASSAGSQGIHVSAAKSNLAKSTMPDMPGMASTTANTVPTMGGMMYMNGDVDAQTNGFDPINPKATGPDKTLPPGLDLTDNQLYAVNTVAFHYYKHPIPLKVGQFVRVYCVNITDFDLINSFHLHANLFNFYQTGTSLQPDGLTDIITMAQGERYIFEVQFKFPGQYMFHAHRADFSNKGWMGMFNVS
jgi:FtsP/CotA-like multicopper oxidase with cupredoxin domain